MSYYHLLDHPKVLQFAFYPSNEWSACPENATDFFVTVEEGVRVACRFHIANPAFPTILFFHGNGEVASDYDDIAQYFLSHSKVNFIVAEFRGYGASDGKPTFAGLISDSHKIFRDVSGELTRIGCSDNIWIMGRSMGSIPALELAKCYPSEIRGLIIESGFPSATRLARLLQFSLPEEDFKLIEDECLQKMRDITIPALIIHGDCDNLITIDAAYTLEKELGSPEKRLFIVRGADHNSVIAYDTVGYFQTIKEFIHNKTN